MSQSKKTTSKVKVSEVKINLGGLNPDQIILATGKLARAQHNVERHTALNGMSVREALASRMVNAQDIKYDLARAFIILE
jgi:hypothetical protein|tara:strand:+ start:184 stop:423 length:240 start_codon:yes stop_codon:yes gene_type:complete